MEKEKFNQNQYIQQYKKEHYSIFKVNLKKDDMECLNKLLKEKGLTKAQFLRNAIDDLKYKVEKEDK